LSSVFAADREHNLGFQGILHSVFQRLETGEGIVIAFTSANPGEGVTHVSNRIAAQLSDSGSGARHLSSAELMAESWSSGPNRFDPFAKSDQMVPKTAWEDWRTKVTQLRARYRYSIVDCPSLAVSSDVLSVAPHVDGIVVVVAANDTHKAQAANVERQIEMVNGKILGYVLNKRKYMVPDWLHKRL